MIVGENLLPSPTQEEAKELIETRTNNKSAFTAFGSDDMFQEKRQPKKNLNDHLENGKEVLGKIGSFFSNSVRKITQKKESNEHESNLQDMDKQEEDNKSWVNDSKSAKIKKGFMSASNSIKDGLWKFGSKTKKIAMDSGRFIKDKTNDVFNKEEKNEDTSNKYNGYFSDTNQKTRDSPEDKVEENSESKKKEQEDVHFI